MFKRLKNNKGFTLIELMLVISIIIILIAVLVPKMSGMKDTAKEAGASANVRTVAAYLTPMVAKYDTNHWFSTKTTADTLNNALYAKLDDGVKNPFSGDDTVSLTTKTKTKAKVAVLVTKSSDYKDPANVTKTNLAGTTVVYLDIDNAKIKVYYLDKKGKADTSSVIDVE